MAKKKLSNIKILELAVLIITLLLTLLIFRSPLSPSPKIELTYSEISNNALKGHIEAKNLEKDNDYVLCINGKQDRPGNTVLMNFSKTENEGYWDFDQVKSDSFGSLSTYFETKDRLPKGNYDAKFLIKDLSNNYRCIAAYDVLKFEIARDNVSESNKTVIMKIL